MSLHSRFFPKATFLALALFSASLFLVRLSAQDAATTPPAGSAAATGGSEAVSLPQLLHQGGPVMYVLGAASVLMVYFLWEGFANLRKKKLSPPALVARLREAFKAGNYQEAWNICITNRCFLSTVVAAGLERVGKGKDAVEFAVEETAMRESTLLKVNTTFLSVIGVVAPMIGLTGTVMGMIKAFHTLGDNGISNPAELAKNIGEVLVATASGLIVAIPAFIFFYILRAMAQGSTLYAESQIYRLIDDIPYEQLSGVRIGEDFSPDEAARTALSRAAVSQKVSRAVSTNCPSCNAPIAVGTSPCPNCGTVLEWGA